MKRDVDVEIGVTIDVNDRRAIDRVLENEDGWQEMFYALETEEDVFGHWAYNAVVNGVQRVNELEGWVDMADDAVTMRQNGYSHSNVWPTDEVED